MSALPVKQNSDGKHPMLRQLELGLADPHSGDDGLDVSFMSRSFCLSGLPLRRQYLKDKVSKKILEPRQEAPLFSRSDGSVSLSIATSPFTLPDGTDISVGVPYGARSRLIILWFTTACRANKSTNSRWLDIGSVEGWLDEVGITANQDSVASAKEQLIRLTFANFTMIMEQEGFDYFRTDKLIESVVFQKEDMKHYSVGDYGRVRFPLGIELSAKAHSRFMSNDVIPVSNEALRKIANNAMSIDLLLYMHYKLPFISPGESELLTWKKLIKQFGNGETQGKFRQVFDASIQKALDAYDGANIDVTPEGLVLRHSDPIRVTKMFAASGNRKPKAELQRIRSSNRIVLPPSAKSVVTGADQTNMEF